MFDKLAAKKIVVSNVTPFAFVIFSAFLGVSNVKWVSKEAREFGLPCCRYWELFLMEIVWQNGQTSADFRKFDPRLLQIRKGKDETTADICLHSLPLRARASDDSKSGANDATEIENELKTNIFR